MSKMSTTFRSVSHGPCSRTGVTSVASDFGGINVVLIFDIKLQSKLNYLQYCEPLFSYLQIRFKSDVASWVQLILGY